MEVWKKISGFLDYEVSSSGRIRSLKKKTIMTPYVSKNGYEQIKLFKNSKRYAKYVHRLVAETFLDCPGTNFEVNHIDGNKLNNFVSNLEWCTHSQNTRHAIKNGLFTPYHLPPNPNPNRKKVKIVETGEVFNSLTDCARHIGGFKTAISACLLGKVKTHKGYHFEEV